MLLVKNLNNFSLVHEVLVSAQAFLMHPVSKLNKFKYIHIYICTKKKYWQINNK